MNSCPNCGSNVNQGEAFCRVCGTKLILPQNNSVTNQQPFQEINNQNESNVQQSINNQNFQQTGLGVNTTLQGPQQPQNNVGYQSNTISDDDLIDAYIGKNADKLKTGNFSANTLCFGFLYVLYRKMWLLGFLLLAVIVVATMFLPSIVSFVFCLSNIAFSLQFKKIYLKHVKEQVDKIKTENTGKTREQLMMLCSQKGGTTLVPVIIFIILDAILIFLVNLGSYETIGDLNVMVPSMLIAGSSSTDTYKYYATSYDDNNTDSCNLVISITNNSYHTDAKQYLEKMIYRSPTDIYSGISQEKINNNDWYYANVKTGYGQEHYYSIQKNGYIYNLQFSISNDNNKTCSSAYNIVINSLSFN